MINPKNTLPAISKMLDIITSTCPNSNLSAAAITPVNIMKKRATLPIIEENDLPPKNEDTPILLAISSTPRFFNNSVTIETTYFPIMKNTPSNITAAIIFGILIFYQYQKTKYTKLVKNITHSIEHIDDKDSQKQLKKIINQHATKDSVEPLLRKILKDLGIIKEKKKKMKEV